MPLSLDRSFYEKKYGKNVVILRVESEIGGCEYVSHWALLGVGPGPTDDRSEISLLEPIGTIEEYIGRDNYDVALGSKQGKELIAMIEKQAERQAFEYLRELPTHWID